MAQLTTNKAVLSWIDEMAAMTQPDKIVWIDGSEEQLEGLRQEAYKTGELIKLNEKELPGCVYHRSALNDVARVEGRTFICCEKKEDAGPTNNWMDPQEMYAKLREIYKGSMKGRTMYVIPYSMSIIGSPFAKYGVELTDSIYVVVSMAIMTRMGKAVFDALGDSPDFIKGLHAKADLDEEKRYIVHFPQDNTIWSVNSGYGGNVLLGKKCFALRIASNLGRREGWMAEHMLILGVENPQGEVRYITGAFPSACGKTNLAMIIPPESYQKKGWKCWTVGDDIAWIRPGPDGRLWAVNPENGFFGVAPGTSMKSNPNAMLSCSKDTIFTNVALTDDGDVWWEGIGVDAPAHLIDWKGNDWKPGQVDADGNPVKAAHPNARFTARACNCPAIAPEWEDPNGVPISAFLFGGRRPSTLPLIYQARDWEHGVFIGSTVGSEVTAATLDVKAGTVRRDPFAMLPFCGYHMGDYFAHWLEIGKKGAAKGNLPKIFCVNWFRKNAEGKFMWPGFGDNSRPLAWVFGRCEGTAQGVDTAIGILPTPESIDLTGIEDQVSKEDLAKLLSVDVEGWKKELAMIKEHYAKFGSKLPKALVKQLEALEARLG